MSLKRSLTSAALRPLMAVESAVRFRTAPQQVRSILILEYMVPLGCCVHLTPLYEAIRQSRPEATITVATRGLGLEVLRHNHFIDHLIETPDPFSGVGTAAQVLGKELFRRGLKPECLLTGVADQRSKIALLAALVGRGWRGGYTQLPEFYYRPLRADKALSQIANNLRLAEMLGCGSGHREPSVFFSKADAAKARAVLYEANPEGLRVIVMVTQTSGGQRTGWHTERFVQVIRYAHERLGCAVVYVGTSPDAGAIDALREAAGGIGVSLAGRTSVTELAGVLAMSDCVVSVDTGTMHVARAVGVPMVVLGPSWQRPTEWMPLGVPHIRILRGPDRDEVPADYQLDEIQAVDVIAAMDALLSEYPASEERRAERILHSLSAIDHVSS